MSECIFELHGSVRKLFCCCLFMFPHLCFICFLFRNVFLPFNRFRRKRSDMFLGLEPFSAEVFGDLSFEFLELEPKWLQANLVKG